MHERAAALDPHVVRKVAELDEVVTLAGVENNPDGDAAPFGRVEGLDYSAVSERVGREVNRPLCLADKGRVDCVKAFLGREMNLLRIARVRVTPRGKGKRRSTARAKKVNRSPA